MPYLVGKDIKPETARGIDAAYKYTFGGKGFLKLSGFYYNVQDYIVHKPVYVNRSPSYQAWAAYNIDAEIYGATLSGSYDGWTSTYVYPSLTATDIHVVT